MMLARKYTWVVVVPPHTLDIYGGRAGLPEENSPEAGWLGVCANKVGSLREQTSDGVACDVRRRSISLVGPLSILARARVGPAA